MVVPENEGEVTVVAYHAGNHNYLPTTVIMQTFTIEPSSAVATVIEQLTPTQVRSARKFVHNGKVFVSFEGRTYDADGRLIR